MFNFSQIQQFQQAHRAQQTQEVTEPTLILKRGKKNQDLAIEHISNLTTKIDLIIDGFGKILLPGFKLQKVMDVRNEARVILREAKAARTLLVKYKNIQYKPKRVRTTHNTGLEKLRPISESMAVFSGWVYGKDQKSRYDVTKYLCDYIKKNELRDEVNKSIILPDSKLKELLQPDEDQKLTYPTMQKYLKNCFEEVVAESLPPPQQQDEKKKKVKVPAPKKQTKRELERERVRKLNEALAQTKK